MSSLTSPGGYDATSTSGLPERNSDGQYASSNAGPAVGLGGHPISNDLSHSNQHHQHAQGDTVPYQQGGDSSHSHKHDHKQQHNDGFSSNEQSHHERNFTQASQQGDVAPLNDQSPGIMGHDTTGLNRPVGGVGAGMAEEHRERGLDRRDHQDATGSNTTYDPTKGGQHTAASTTGEQNNFNKPNTGVEPIGQGQAPALDGQHAGHHASQHNGQQHGATAGSTTGATGTGTKPKLTDKIFGAVEALVGKATHNPEKVEEGQARKVEGKAGVEAVRSGEPTA